MASGRWCLKTKFWTSRLLLCIIWLKVTHTLKFLVLVFFIIYFTCNIYVNIYTFINCSIFKLQQKGWRHKYVMKDAWSLMYTIMLVIIEKEKLTKHAVREINKQTKPQITIYIVWYRSEHSLFAIITWGNLSEWKASINNQVYKLQYNLIVYFREINCKQANNKLKDKTQHSLKVTN